MNPVIKTAVFALGLCVAAAGGASAATKCVSPSGTGGCSTSIQAAIDAANPGDTILIKKGVYAENVIVTRSLTLVGESRERTIIVPAMSNAGCVGGSLCSGLASNVILVQANNVTIRNLTIDGDNPNLTSGIVRGGADLDAHNGIITNHAAGVFNGLRVVGVTVRNIYLRGIYASSGGTFEFRDNKVSNVQGDPNSIAIFNFGGGGIVAENEVTDANDAIASNWSTGTRYLDNEISRAASGIHTDNAGGFGSVGPETIRGNALRAGVVGGWGVWVFNSYVPVTIDDNTVEDVDMGLAVFGQATPVGRPVFSRNRVQGKNAPGGAGVFVSTDLVGWGQADVSATFTENVVTHNIDAFVIDAETSHAVTVLATCNSIRHNSNAGVTLTNGDATASWYGTTPPGGLLNVTFTNNVIKNKTVGMANLNATPGLVDAANNWWGCAGGPVAPGCDKVVGSIVFSPPLAHPPACVPRGDGDDDKGDKRDGDRDGKDSKRDGDKDGKDGKRDR